MTSMIIRNPRTGEYDFELPLFSAAQVEQEAKLLRTNQHVWQQYTVTQRAAIVAKLIDKIAGSKDSLVNALVVDTGRYQESVLEVDVIIQGIKRWCNHAPEILAPKDEQQADIPLLKIKQSTVPYSLVGIISPWNFPLLLSVVDAIPVLNSQSQVG